VIRSFRDRDAARLFEREPVRKLGADIQRVALRKLRQLDAAVALEDLKVPPGNRLERLRGGRAGQYSIRINDQWRICFVWDGTRTIAIEVVDYH
jgi:proteic killer suppression protein